MKFKKIKQDYCITLLDRLTRFEPASVRYKRLFDDIISKFYLETDVKKLSDTDKINIAAEIINNSFPYCEFDDYFCTLFMKLEEFYFKNDSVSYQYLSKRLNICNIISSFGKNSIKQKNILWLMKIFENKPDLKNLENPNSVLYPVKKIILCEGQTEFILLSTIFKLFDTDLENSGVYILPAGGKNQVARKYYKMSDIYNIPFFILLDNDAAAVKDTILAKLRSNDRLYLIKSGEFEDLIPAQIIKLTLNYIHKNDYNCTTEDFNTALPMVKNIENICKKYGFGEYKKASFASYLNDYIKSHCTKSDFFESEITEIIDAFKTL